MRCWKTKDRLWSVSGERHWDICTLTRLTEPSASLKGVVPAGKKGFYPVTGFLIRFLSPLWCCIDSLPAAEAPACGTHLHTAPLPARGQLQSGHNSRICTAGLKIMRNTAPHSAIRVLASILLPMVQKTKNTGGSHLSRNGGSAFEERIKPVCVSQGRQLIAGWIPCCAELLRDREVTQVCWGESAPEKQHKYLWMIK